jgi:signal transduction histidine kinase
MLRRFAAALLAAALAFLGASAATLLASRAAARGATELGASTLPGISQLMHARTVVHRLDANVELLTASRAAQPALVDAVESTGTELSAVLRAAVDISGDAAERALYERDVVPTLTRLDGAIERLREAVNLGGGGEGSFTAAVWDLDAAAKQVDGAVTALAETVRTTATNVAWRIARSSVDTLVLAFACDAAAIGVTVVAAAWAVQSGRRFAEEMRGELQGERARVSELDLLAQRVAHDITSPLAAVALSLSSIRRLHPDAETEHTLDRAWRALERSRQMVHGIYAFAQSGAHPAAGAAAPLRETIVKAVDELLCAEAQSPPAVEVEPFDEVRVAMDPSLLGVVLSNLLSNAAKFTRDSPVRRITVRARADERRAHVEVEDTGPGVPADQEEAIFQPYRRGPDVAQPGLGLGLATVRRLVLTHGGEVGVRRGTAGGALFWFELPRAPA